MPHECINCGYRFDDGSREMLEGCPDCGGSKFLFTKTKTKTPSQPESESASDIIEATSERETPEAFGGSFVKGEPDKNVGDALAREQETREPDEMEAAETPDPEELREELESRFESIKILEPGSYELNLMNLYDKEEKIIALQEDGRYQVSLPSAMKDDHRGP